MKQCSGRFWLVGFPVTARRVVRGGSWNNNQTHARAAYRNFNAPDNRNNNIGFRLARASPIQRHWSLIAARMTFPPLQKGGEGEFPSVRNTQHAEIQP